MSALSLFKTAATDAAGNVSEASAASIEGTPSADIINYAYGGATITGNGGHDGIGVAGHTASETFVYNAASDLPTRAQASSTSSPGFADTGNGSTFNDVVNLAPISGITNFIGALQNANAMVPAHSVAYDDDEPLNETLIFANAGTDQLGQTSPTLMEICLAGGHFNLLASNFHPSKCPSIFLCRGVVSSFVP